MHARAIASILICRLSAHGDVIQTLPLLAAIRAAQPDARIGWLIEESAAPLLQGHPLIDQLHVVRRKSWLQTLARSPWRIGRVLREVLALRRDLRAARYDASFDAQGLLKSAIWPVLAGIPQRLGYAGVREQAWRLYTRRLGVYNLREADKPTVFQFMEFVTALGPQTEAPCPSPQAREALVFPLAPVPETARQAAKTLLATLADAPSSPRPLIALAPATLWASKRWPEGHWRALLGLMAEWPVDVAILGGPDDAAAHEALAQGILTPQASARLLNVTGRTDWPTLTALLSSCDVLVGPDSAPLHLAQALASQPDARRPRIVGLYGPTSDGRTGPIQRERHVCVTANAPCRPCFERRCPLDDPAARNACMDGISPEQVLQAIAAQLAALGLRLDAARSEARR